MEFSAQFLLYSKGGNFFTREATLNQHPPAHHPLDAPYYSVVDEPQLSLYFVSPW
jgi:hypothetical protein